jgi:hypothetical protein
MDVDADGEYVHAHFDNTWRSIHDKFLAAILQLYGYSTEKLSVEWKTKIIAWLSKNKQYSFFDTTRKGNSEMWKRGWRNICARITEIQERRIKECFSDILMLISEHAPKDWLEEQAIQLFHEDWPTFQTLFPQTEPFATHLAEYIRSHGVVLRINTHPQAISYYLAFPDMPPCWINDNTNMFVSQNFVKLLWRRYNLKRTNLLSLHENCKSFVMSILFQMVDKEFGSVLYTNCWEGYFDFVASTCYRVAPFVMW